MCNNMAALYNSLIDFIGMKARYSHYSCIYARDSFAVPAAYSLYLSNCVTAQCGRDIY